MFQLRGENVRHCDLLKLAGIAECGGQGKQLVAAGEVKVDGQLESRKAARIRGGAGRGVSRGEDRSGASRVSRKAEDGRRKVEEGKWGR